MDVVNAVLNYFAAIVAALASSSVLTLPVLGVLIAAALVLSLINHREKS